MSHTHCPISHPPSSTKVATVFVPAAIWPAAYPLPGGKKHQTPMRDSCEETMRNPSRPSPLCSLICPLLDHPTNILVSLILTSHLRYCALVLSPLHFPTSRSEEGLPCLLHFFTICSPFTTLQSGSHLNQAIIWLQSLMASQRQHLRIVLSPQPFWLLSDISHFEQPPSA